MYGISHDSGHDTFAMIRICLHYINVYFPFFGHIDQLKSMV